MKIVLPLCVLLALTIVAQAQEKPPLQDKPAPSVPAQKKVEEKPVPDINKSPWSVDSRTSSDGLQGKSTTTLKRDIGDGLSIGGQMQRQYQEPAVGGHGPPGPLESGRSGTIFGPVLEKKF